MARSTSRFIVIAAAAAVALSAASPAFATAHATTPLTRAQGIETRLLTQQGLAVALANGVLQGNLILAEVGFPGSSGVKVDHCYDFEGVGVKVLSLKQPSTSKTVVVDELYYDSTCAKPYIQQSATLTSASTSGADTLAATETWVYRSPVGTKLGTFSAKAAVIDSTSGRDLHGAGTFVPATRSAPHVALGLTCTTPTEADGATSSTWTCAGGVAQKFAALKLALGSLTPLTLVVHNSTSSLSGFGKVSFSGSGAQLRESTAAIGVALTKTNALTLTGKPSSAGTDATKGSAARFALFTPRPTGWTITDAHAHTAFSLTVSDATLHLSGKVIDTRTEAVLATIALDRSGTGTITYRGAKAVRISSWLLAG